MNSINFWMPIALTICGFIAPVAAAEQRRPNILFCFADDWGRFASIYREVDGPGTPNDLIKTPHIDRIAKEGVLFRNAFVNAPSCTPCRSSLLSGQYFWRTGRGAILQGAKWDDSIPAFPLLLKDAGYHLGKMYKVWSPGSPTDAPIGRQAHAYQKHGGRMNQFSQTVTKLVANGVELEAAKQQIFDEVRQNFRDFLADQPDDAPFFFWFGPTNVHRKWIKGSGQALWGLNPNELKGKLPGFLPDVPEVRQDLADYLGEAMAYDAAIGVLLEELKRQGRFDNTVIAISGDHGAPGFPHGKCNLYDFGTHVTLAMKGPGIPGNRIVDDFVNLTDLAPTFLEFGDVSPPAVMTGCSLLPTLQSREAGQVDESRSFVVTGRERHVSMARDDYRPYPQRALRTKDYLLILNFHPERWPLGNPYNLDLDPGPTAQDLTEETYTTFMDDDAGPTKAWLVLHRNEPAWKPYFDRAYARRPRIELYALTNDPDQLANVANLPQYAEVSRNMERQLMDILRSTNDPRVENHGVYFETPPLAGPVEGVRKPRNSLTRPEPR